LTVGRGKKEGRLRGNELQRLARIMKGWGETKSRTSKMKKTFYFNEKEQSKSFWHDRKIKSELLERQQTDAAGKK